MGMAQRNANMKYRAKRKAKAALEIDPPIRRITEEELNEAKRKSE